MTGPSLQTHWFPSVVFSTQQRQAPTPHAILFSRETSHSTPAFLAKRATLTIIGLGPQVEIISNFSFSRTEWLVTKPTSPAEPSSVVMHTFPILANSSSSSRSVALRAPSRKVTSAPKSLMSFRNRGAEPHLRHHLRADISGSSR